MRVLAATLFISTTVLSGCVDTVEPELSGPRHARVVLRAAIPDTLPTDGALQVNAMTVWAYDHEAGESIGITQIDLDPSLDEWWVELRVPVPEPPEAEHPLYFSVGLMHREWRENPSGGFSGGGSVQWSGRTEPFPVTAGEDYTIAEIEMLRGITSNRQIEAISIDSIPPIAVGEEYLIRSTLTMPDTLGNVRLYYASLDPEVAVISGEQGLLGVSPGTVRVMAIAGWVADTVTAVVTPATVPPPP